MPFEAWRGGVLLRWSQCCRSPWASANTTIFTLLNGILLRPLAVNDPSSLAAVYTTDPKTSGNLAVSYLNYKDYRDRNSIFSNLTLYATIAVNLTGMGDPHRLMAHIVSGNYFQTLGVRPIIGRRIPSRRGCHAQCPRGGCD